MASFKSIFKRAEVSRIGLQGENSIIRPKHKTVFYMNPGSKQLFENENETDKILEISLIKRPTGAKFCVKIVSGEENFLGTIVHPQNWTSKHDQMLKGKRVALIGSGATAITIFPGIKVKLCPPYMITNSNSST